MSKKIPAASVLALTNGEFDAAKPAKRTRKQTNADAKFAAALAEMVERQAKATGKRARASAPLVEQPKRNGNVAALKACRTMVTNRLRGASATVRKELKAKIADYDRRIAEAA